MSKYQLAQVNIARMLGPIDGPVMEGFVAQLDEINSLADNSDGFVWRLQNEDGDATSYRPFPEDDMMIINMSVWESVEALFEYTYKSDHVKVMCDRAKWFEPLKEMHMVLWWIPEGHIPTEQEAIEKLTILQKNGPSEEAFTFKEHFPQPS